MTSRLQRPDWVRRINLMADSVGGDPRDLVPIDAAQLLDTAAVSLLETLGPPDGDAGDLGDPLWQHRFESLVVALDAAPMHVVGRLMTKQELLRSLRTRLLLTAAVDADPGIAASPIAEPIVITGPARSGTSILFELLALDPDLRAPTAAEALHPLAPRGAPDTAGTPDPLTLSECEQEFWADVQPEFQAVHELRSDLPVECVTLTQGSFCGFHWSMIAALALDAWMPDPQVNYAYERIFLQVLQELQARRPAAANHDKPTQDARPKQWLLKTPGHLMMLPLLFRAFDDAWVVQTHRDPAKTIPSTVSTSTMIHWLRNDEVNVEASAQSVNAAFTAGLNGSVDLRSSGAVPEDRFVDIHFAELMTDPVATLRAAYARMDREFTDQHAAAVLDYLARKPKGKFGVHRYRPEDWGFTAAGLRSATQKYIEHFDVAQED